MTGWMRNIMAEAMQASCRDARPKAFLLSFLLSSLFLPAHSLALDPAYSPAVQAQMDAAKERRKQTAYERINKIIHGTETTTSSGAAYSPPPPRALMPVRTPTVAPPPTAARYQPVVPLAPVAPSPAASYQPIVPSAPVTPPSASIPLPAQSISPTSPFYVPPTVATSSAAKTTVAPVAVPPPPPTSFQPVVPAATPPPVAYTAPAKPLELAPVVNKTEVALPPPPKGQQPTEGVVADKTYILKPGESLPPTATTPPPVPAAGEELAEPPVVAGEQLLPEVAAAIEATTEAPKADLSPETEEILSGIPVEIIGRPKSKELPDDFTMDRVDPATGLGATKGTADNAEATSSSETLGMNVAVKQRPIDVDYELEKAYVALVGGSPDEAIGIYKEVLDIDPNNGSALFGLATTYHRVGLLDEARPIYGKLLKLEPRNKDAINNFLVLVGEEAPERALAHMEHLEEQNPEFAPIPAQMALLHTKLGNMPEAIKAMQRAVNLSPENLVYKYNLAILYDKAEKPVEASILYKQLLDARFRGETIPADADQIQQRLTFLLSNG